MSEQTHSQSGLGPETTAGTLALTVDLSAEQYEELEFRLDRVTEVTSFSRDDAVDACAVLAGLGFDADAVIECLGPVAAYAHAHDRPIDAVAEQIGMVMGLSDLGAGDLPGLLDLSEEVGE